MGGKNWRKWRWLVPLLSPWNGHFEENVLTVEGWFTSQPSSGEKGIENFRRLWEKFMYKLGDCRKILNRPFLLNKLILVYICSNIHNDKRSSHSLESTAQTPLPLPPKNLVQNKYFSKSQNCVYNVRSISALCWVEEKFYIDVIIPHVTFKSFEMLISMCRLSEEGRVRLSETMTFILAAARYS